MQLIDLPRQKRKIEKRKQESFEIEQKEAFRQFMKAHATDPLFEECVLKLYF